MGSAASQPTLPSICALLLPLLLGLLLLTRRATTAGHGAAKMMTKSEAMYKIYRKHDALFAGDFIESWIHPDMLQLVRRVNETDPSLPPQKVAAALAPLLREESPQVYSFNCLSAEFLHLFNEEIENFYEISEAFHIPVQRPNSMNNYGVIVNQIGMRPLITDFQQRYLWPLARRLFPREGAQFDDHHSFLVRYQSGEDLGLDMHVDDSDVTFNVCLGHRFTGATLSFCGMFGAPDHRKWVHTYHHEVGRGVMHLGSRRHGADDIESGMRSNLIVWNHNSLWRSSPEYNRRRSSAVYQRESSPPDPVCVSYTHDRDYVAYRKLPDSKKGEHFHPWCPPPGKEYDGFQRLLEDDDSEVYRGDL